MIVKVTFKIVQTKNIYSIMIVKFTQDQSGKYMA